MLANAAVVIVLQYTNISNQHVVRLKLTQCYMPIVSKLKIKIFLILIKFKVGKILTCTNIKRAYVKDFIQLTN